MRYQKFIFHNYETGKIVEERLIPVSEEPQASRKVTAASAPQRKAPAISPWRAQWERDERLLAFAGKVVAEQEARDELAERLRWWFRA